MSAPAPTRAARAKPATAARIVHVVADTDTRWKWATATARRVALTGSTGDAVHGHLLRGRATPSDQQLDDINAEVTTVRRVGMAELLADLQSSNADVVVLGCVGGTIQSLLQSLAVGWRGRRKRPVVVTGYVGLVYERLVDGLLLRAGADVLLANSAADADRFRSVYSAVGADADSVVRTALPFLGGMQYDPAPAGRDWPFTVCFATQPSVPAARADRRYALAQAAQHARLHPDRRVLIKLRGRPGEQTTHIERHHYVSLLPGEEIPGNLEFRYGSMSDALDETDLCVTVSSTAALEAMHRGIPTAVLTDFGVRESLGNHVFLRSGALTSWPALHDGYLPTAEHAWLAENGVVDTDPYSAAIARVGALVGTELPVLRPWLSTERAPQYLPTLLTRNGLDADARPLFGAVGDRPAIGRRMARGAARGVYRFSVRRVEPAVRRWAQL